MTLQHVPTPKYKIGDIVWTASVTPTEKALPCPDCLGGHKWLVKTPAGAEMEVTCQRCSNRYSSTNLPSLRYHEFIGFASQLTIGSVRIDTAANSEFGQEPIGYMCNETGIGSGSIYRESLLYSTEAEAKTAADADAAMRNAEKKATPERLEQMEFSSLSFEAAHLQLHNRSVWNSWWAYRNLRQEIESILEDVEKGEISEKEIAEFIQEKLDWDKRRRDLPAAATIIDLLNTAAETGNVGPLKGILGRYEELRRDVPASVPELAA